jgi:hypothetical protein
MTFAASTASLCAGEPQHHHPEQVINSRPVISLLPVELDQPRRVLVRQDGSIVISDWGAGNVISYQAGRTSVLAADLSQPSGLAEDADGNIYVSLYAGGEPDKGSVLQLSQLPGTKNWRRQTLASTLTGPTDIAVEASGRIIVAEYTANRISHILPDGSLELGIATLSTPSSVVLDREGRLFATSSKAGTVVSIPSSGEPIVLCDGLDAPSDLALDDEDSLVAISYKSNSIVRVDSDRKTFKRIATVPAGTIGIAYQKDGNFIVVNWEMQSATRVTNRLLMDCPHCEGKIPIRLKPNPRRSIF